MTQSKTVFLVPLSADDVDWDRVERDMTTLRREQALIAEQVSKEYVDFSRRSNQRLMAMKKQIDVKSVGPFIWDGYKWTRA